MSTASRLRGQKQYEEIYLRKIQKMTARAVILFVLFSGAMPMPGCGEDMAASMHYLAEPVPDELRTFLILCCTMPFMASLAGPRYFR